MDGLRAGARDAVLVVGDDEGSLLANAAFTDLLGGVRALQAAHDPAGRPLPTEQAPQRRAARGEEFSLEFTLGLPAFAGRAFEARGGPIRDRDGRSVGGVLVIRDITERKRAERELRADATLYRSTFTDAAVGMAVLDLDGRFLRANRAFLALLRYDEGALLATDCLAVTDDDDRERYRQSLEALRGGVSANVTLEVRYRTGTGRTIAVVNQIAVAGGGTGSATLIALAQERHPLALRRAQEEFAATVSHDLRTPLTVIQAGLGLLASSAADRLLPPERDLLDNLTRNAARLKQLISDLLSFNQLRVAALQGEVVSFDLRIALHAAFAPLYPLLDRRRQDLGIALDEALPVEGDSRQLEQAFLNLLYAIHSAAPSRARLAVRGWTTPGELRVTISAPGVEEFATDGEGLELTVARGIIELHGGQLSAESATGPPPRLTLTITLPRSKASLARQGMSTTMTEDGDGTEAADRGR